MEFMSSLQNGLDDHKPSLFGMYTKTAGNVNALNRAPSSS